jgi:hypothetical protein
MAYRGPRRGDRSIGPGTAAGFPQRAPAGALFRGGFPVQFYTLEQERFTVSCVMLLGWDNRVGKFQCAASRSTSSLRASWPMFISASLLQAYTPWSEWGSLSSLCEREIPCEIPSTWTQTHNTAIRAEIGDQLRVLLSKEQPSPPPRIQHVLDCLSALDATGAGPTG